MDIISMKEIQLTRGYIALVDEDVFEDLNKYKWCALVTGKSNYVCAQGYINKKRVYMHRYIMGLTDPKIYCDHIDMNTLNNTKANLRICTPAQNRYNTVSRINAESKYKGVTKHGNKWKAQIAAEGKVVYLGLFKTELDAAKAYNEQAEILHGNYARLNILELSSKN